MPVATEDVGVPQSVAVALGGLDQLEFFGRLRWIDGRPLLDTIEPYRRELFTKALDTFEPDGRPHLTWWFVAGQKELEIVRPGFGRAVQAVNSQITARQSFFILANDEGQAG